MQLRELVEQAGHGMALMEGKGGYEGLSYSMTNLIDPVGRGQPQGLIWEGDMPPLPDAELLPD